MLSVAICERRTIIEQSRLLSDGAAFIERILKSYRRTNISHQDHLYKSQKCSQE